MSDYVTSNVETRHVQGDWGVNYRYTYGVAGERFFRGLKDRGVLLASRCPKCRKRFLPPALYCEDCFVETGEYEPVEGAGTVDAFTVLHESLDETTLETPIVVAFVRFDGVAGGLAAPLHGLPPEQVRIGLKVRLAVNKGLPTNSIKDLTWAPA